ncbi:hypothetical protein QTI51_37150 [Variovorax sp. J22G73]|uniref:hypothetical protein n=1 Tax=unclassified Variovorax TaxID=663243 RepID=UPI0025790E54|nr:MULTISPECIES: hypothetical protein [unclassified Variovorax]MDM0010184.1 hypothetical protein [Variovorax sp. J22R203]MDM0102954.1 hypothetical protein [Variovorax sp. J22G73]
MSQPDFFNNQVTIIRIPSWLGRDVHEEQELPLTLGDYKVTLGNRWTVTSLKTDEVVYNGIGPVEVVRERAKA